MKFGLYTPSGSFATYSELSECLPLVKLWNGELRVCTGPAVPRDPVAFRKASVCLYSKGKVRNAGWLRDASIPSCLRDSGFTGWTSNSAGTRWSCTPGSGLLLSVSLLNGEPFDITLSGSKTMYFASLEDVRKWLV